MPADTGRDRVREAGQQLAGLLSGGRQRLVGAPRHPIGADVPDQLGAATSRAQPLPAVTAEDERAAGAVLAEAARGYRAAAGVILTHNVIEGAHP